MKIDVASVVWELMRERHRTVNLLNLISRHPAGAVFRYQLMVSDTDSKTHLTLNHNMRNAEGIFVPFMFTVKRVVPPDTERCVANHGDLRRSTSARINIEQQSDGNVERCGVPLRSFLRNTPDTPDAILVAPVGCDVPPIGSCSGFG